MLVVVSTRAVNKGFAYGSGVQEVPSKIGNDMIKAKVAAKPSSADADLVEAFYAQQVKVEKVKLDNAEAELRRAKETLLIFEQRVAKEKKRVSDAEKALKSLVEAREKAETKAKKDK
jgi:predicted S18 family serine protease